MKKINKGKGYSIVNYIMFIAVCIISVILTTMVIVVKVLTEGAVPTVIRDSLVKENRKIEECIKLESGDAITVENYKSDFEAYTGVVIDHNGTVIWGKVPDNFKDIKSILNIKRINLEQMNNGSRLYIRKDRVRMEILPNHTSPEDAVFICGFIDESKVTTVYDRIKILSYAIVSVACLLLLVFCYYISRKMSEPLNKMYEVTERFGNSMSFDDPIEENSSFKEINSFAHAYNKLLEQVEHTYERQKRFNSDVSHELKTPIAVMSAQCQVIKNRYNNSKVAYNAMDAEALEVMERQIKIMNNLVSQLLEISRLESGSFDLYSETVDLKDIIESVCEDMDILTDGKQKFELELEDYEFTGNNGLMICVIRNLISNAVKYNIDYKPITVKVWFDDDYLNCLIKDNGMGIPKEKLDDIFEPFFRMEESRSSEGFGLGLTLTKRIIDSYGGSITVDSIYGEGSQFLVTFPLLK
ncbi:MAG: HAMP domain-containing histidine kinase [Lachnospiraceae bacterium]|nr:HAMP domain-containing histidine kinase [Lachnospiraceae bacterium]